MKKQLILGITLLSVMTAGIGASAAAEKPAAATPVHNMIHSVNEAFSQYLTTHIIALPDGTEQEAPIYDFSSLDSNIEVCMHPITGAYSLRRLNDANGTYERSYDGGTTWAAESK